MFKMVASLLGRKEQNGYKPNYDDQKVAKEESRKTLLVVEDDDDTRNLLIRYLKKDYEMVGTGDATEGLRLVLERRPSCILLDLNLPRFSGIELGKILSDMTVTQLIPIIVISGESASEYKEVCEKFGSVDYIEKPLNFSYVKSRVAEVLKSTVAERRRSVRVKLKASLMLKTTDANGQELRFSAFSDDVSTGGFSCSFTGALQVDSIVEVLLNASKPILVGRARVARIERRGTIHQRYGFQFVTPATNWVLK